MNKTTALFILLSLSIFSFTEACEVRVSWEPWIPYQFKQKSGTPGGLDPELLEAILKEIGCKPLYVELPWARQLVANEIGNTDIVMGASKSPEREKFANFTTGYRFETVALFVKKGLEQTSIKKVSDFSITKLKLGAVKGNLYTPEIDALISKFDASANDDETNVKKLLANRIDGFIVDLYTGTNLIKEAHATDSIIHHPVNISTSEVYFMVSKKSKIENLTEKISKAVKKLKANGTLTKIISKY